MGTPSFDHSKPVLKAVDLIAYHVAAEISAQKRPEGVDHWIAAAPTAAAERFVIGLALHAPKPESYSPSNVRVKKILMSYLLREEGAGGLPTVQRLLPATYVTTVEVPTPEITQRLRSMDWRDAAGRNIDTFLIEGTFSARHNPIPPLDQDVDRTVASGIDSRLPGDAFSLEVAIKSWGVVLSHSHRQALANLQEDMQRGSPPGQADEFHRLTNMVFEPPSAEIIRDLLDLERANRSMSQRASAAGQEHAPCETSVPLTL